MSHKNNLLGWKYIFPFSVIFREIEELTQYINKAEMKINEILDENEELRYKLGMDPREPLNLTEFRKNKAIRHEELKAVNFTLQREVSANITLAILE